MELVLAVAGVGGLAAGMLRPLSRRGLGGVEAILVALFAAAVGVGVLLSWGLLVGLVPVVALAVWAVAGLGIGAIAVRDAGVPWDVARGALGTVRQDPWLWGVTSLVLLAQVVLTVLMLTNVGDVGWDAGTYHLPATGSMIQEGSLFGFPDLRPWMYYPALVEVQATILGTGFGSVRAASLTQLGYWMWVVMFVAAVLGRRVRSGVAIAGVVVVASIPTLWLQTRTLYVDVAFAATFTAAAVLVVIAWRERSRALVLLAALLTGALFGMKLGALAALPLVAAVALVAVVVVRLRRGLVLVVALGVVAAAPFLVRNAIEWSNPTYPVSLTEAREPVDGLPGDAPYSLSEIEWYVDTVQRPDWLEGEGFAEASVLQYVVSPTRVLLADLGLTESNPEVAAPVNTRDGGFGFAWLVVLLAAATVVPAVLWSRRQAPSRPPEWLPVAGGLALLAAVSYVVTQSAWWPRFTLGQGIVTLLAALLVLDRSRIGPVVAAVAILLGGTGLVMTERDGGYPHWTACDHLGCVASADARQAVRQFALSGLTLEFEPLAAAGVDSVAIVGDEPNGARPYFPAGLWSPDWQVDVTTLTIGSEPVPGACHDAYLADRGAQEWTAGWIAGSDPHGDFEVVRWDDRRDERVFLIRTSPCASVEEGTDEE